MTINVEIILYIAGAVITISTAIGVIGKLVRKSIERICINIVKQVLESYEKAVDIKIDSLFDTLDQFVKETKEIENNNRELFASMACVKINESYVHFIKQGSISTYSLAILEEIFEKYRSIGGNHLAAKQIEQLRKLPIVNEDMNGNPIL